MSASTSDLPRRRRRLPLAATARSQESGEHLHAHRKTEILVPLSPTGRVAVRNACAGGASDSKSAIAFLSGISPAQNGPITAVDVKPIGPAEKRAFELDGKVFYPRSLLGAGSFGDAYHYETGDRALRLAVKFFRSEESALKEASTLHNLNGSECAPIVSRFAQEKPNSFYAILMPLANFDLTALVSKLPTKDALAVAGAVYELSACIFYETGYAYTDIRPENVLAFCQPAGDGVTISLGDLGSFAATRLQESDIVSAFHPPFPWLRERMTLGGKYNPFPTTDMFSPTDLTDWMLWATLITAYELSETKAFPIQAWPGRGRVMLNLQYETWLIRASIPIERLMRNAVSGGQSAPYQMKALSLMEKVTTALRDTVTPRQVFEVYQQLTDTGDIAGEDELESVTRIFKLHPSQVPR